MGVVGCSAVSAPSEGVVAGWLAEVCYGQLRVAAQPVPSKGRAAEARQTPSRQTEGRIPFGQRGRRLRYAAPWSARRAC